VSLEFGHCHYDVRFADAVIEGVAQHLRYLRVCVNLGHDSAEEEEGEESNDPGSRWKLLTKVEHCGDTA
jgi:hypothetical protein